MLTYSASDICITREKEQGGPSSLNVIGSLFCTQGKMLQTLPKEHVISCTCVMLLDSRQSEFTPASK